jgi:hypothetical protein
MPHTVDQGTGDQGIGDHTGRAGGTEMLLQ